MKKIIQILWIFLLLLSFSACNKTAQVETLNKKLKIVTTFAPLYSFTKNITKDLAEVDNLLPIGASVHNWEPTISDIKKIARADIVIQNGLHLEEFLDKLLQISENPELIVIDTSEKVNLLKLKEEETDHEKKELESNHHEEKEDESDYNHEEPDHHHGEFDPHIWLSPERAKTQIQNISKILEEKDQANTKAFRKNTEEYIEKITLLQEEIHSNFKNIEKKEFIVFHDAYGYFLEEFELSKYKKASIEAFPGKKPSPAYMQKIVSLIEKEHVNIIFTEPQFSPKIVQTLEEELNLQSYEINPIGYEISQEGYEKTIKEISNTFLKAFSQ